MSNFLFFGVLRALAKGSAIRGLMTFLLRALSIVTLVLGAYFLYLILANGFREGMPTELVILALLTILIFAATIVAAAQIFWFRSNSAHDIPEGPFIAIPVFAVFVRAIGEVYACVIVALGLVGCFGIWIAKGEGRPPMKLPGFDLPNPTLFENSFFQGLLVLVLVLLAAVVYLLLFYFFAEAIVVTVDIAVNVRMLVRGGTATPLPAPEAPQYAPQPPMQYGPPQPQYGPPQYGTPQAPPYAAPQAPAMGPRCPNCGNEVPPGTSFCVRCGATLVPPGA
jgi:hypothetical protein